MAPPFSSDKEAREYFHKMLDKFIDLEEEEHQTKTHKAYVCTNELFADIKKLHNDSLDKRIEQLSYRIIEDASLNKLTEIQVILLEGFWAFAILEKKKKELKVAAEREIQRAREEINNETNN